MIGGIIIASRCTLINIQNELFLKGQFEMLFDFINLNSGMGATYLRLYAQIKSAVESGIIKPGEKLPSIREAAAQLNISRTTVENAYLKLCIEGAAESSPQRGYYICESLKPKRTANVNIAQSEALPFDFSGRRIDSLSADAEVWKKTVREVLRDTGELTSYGDPQGEPGLRQALADYSYKARGVKASPENIVIGAGIGPLLSLICGLTGREYTVGMEQSGFSQARQIFSDYGIEFVTLESDLNGAKPESIEKSGAEILFLMPSALSKISITGLSARRNEFVKWAQKDKKRLIIEDDYNGELRYTARSVTAFQGKYPSKTVYIGSFSKLLLPSVRIAYMALPDSLAEEFRKRRAVYNQTCGKVEQLALKSYIESGALEKHLRRLRKLYYAKSQNVCKAIREIFPKSGITLYESSLTVGIDLKSSAKSNYTYNSAIKYGIRLTETKKAGEVRLCFAGIADSDIYPALEKLKECAESFKENS